MCLWGAKNGLGWRIKISYVLILCITNVNLVYIFHKNMKLRIHVLIFGNSGCFFTNFNVKMQVRLTLRPTHGRISITPVENYMSMFRVFYGLPNKKKRASKLLILTSSVANVYTHTNTNLNTEKRRGILIATFASAYAFYGLKFTSCCR